MLHLDYFYPKGIVGVIRTADIYCLRPRGWKMLQSRSDASDLIFWSWSVSLVLIFFISFRTWSCLVLLVSMFPPMYSVVFPPFFSNLVHCMLVSIRSVRALLASWNESTASANDIWTAFGTVLAARASSNILSSLCPIRSKWSFSNLSESFFFLSYSSIDFGFFDMPTPGVAVFILMMLEDTSLPARVLLSFISPPEWSSWGPLALDCVSMWMEGIGFLPPGLSMPFVPNVGLRANRV